MASESTSTTTGAGSTSALTIREIIPTNRTPEVWKDFNMCIMTNGAAESESGSGAAALNPCFNVSGVDYLIENISRDLEFEDDGFATTVETR
ncbi:hypothetical protein Tco_1269392 [Tanacetum coccineum]